MQHGDVVGELEHHFHVVLDQERAQVPFRQHILEDLYRARGLLDRQALGRLVASVAGLLRDRHGDFEQALVAVREHGGGDVRQGGEPQPLDRRVGDGEEEELSTLPPPRNRQRRRSRACAAMRTFSRTLRAGKT